jgi:hypothetical protein
MLRGWPGVSEIMIRSSLAGPTDACGTTSNREPMVLTNPHGHVMQKRAFAVVSPAICLDVLLQVA